MKVKKDKHKVWKLNFKIIKKIKTGVVYPQAGLKLCFEKNLLLIQNTISVNHKTLNTVKEGSKKRIDTVLFHWSKLLGDAN